MQQHIILSSERYIQLCINKDNESNSNNNEVNINNNNNVDNYNSNNNDDVNNNDSITNMFMIPSSTSTTLSLE
jgi:hypothetical protein